MNRAAAALCALALLAGPARLARADEAAPALGPLLAGNTVSAVMFLPHDAPKGGGSLERVMFQAYLRTDGSALIRRWDAARDAYTVPAEGRWSASASTLCLDFPGFGAAPRVCVEAHVWGPRIAGNTVGEGRFALLDGDIAPGNAIIAAR
ncbi:MAG TPA: hypothetical protein VN802_11270 [Stellaceae bacterium]|nr:hypothetical protein [Stellaceae bacterium]